MHDLIIPEPLRVKARELSLSDDLAADLLRSYAPHYAAGAALKEMALSLPEISPAKAREIRLAMVRVRTGSDKTRKGLKSDGLLRGRAIDGLHALIEIGAQSVETQMEDIELAAERAEAARISALRESRLVQLRPYVTDPSVYPVEKMDGVAFAELVESSRMAHAAREQARVAAEAAQIAQVEAAAVAAREAELKRQEELAAAKWEAEEMRKLAAKEADAKAAAERAVEDARIAAALAKAEQGEAAAAAWRRENEAKESAERAAREAKRQVDLAQAAAEAAEHHRQEQALRIAQMEAAAEATRLREEAEVRDAVARAAHRAKQEQENRAAVVSRIAADLAALKKDGRISSMSALAECIVSGGLRGVTVDWEVA